MTKSATFTIYNTCGERWAEFECPVCSIDVDYEIANLPPYMTRFTCLGCGESLRARYVFSPWKGLDDA